LRAPLSLREEHYPTLCKGGESQEADV
jgi:hypothetical protein